MRTPEQIANLRRVLMTMTGPYALMLSNEDIDSWANRLQEQVNGQIIKSLVQSWEIKIRADYNISTPWEVIEKEPTIAVCTLDNITSKCYDLLIKYPTIDSIQIMDKASHTEIHIFKRD